MAIVFQAASPISSNISSTVDGAYYGTLISICLLGISIVQGWSYFHHNHDRWGLRTLVGVLLSLNFAKSWADSGILHFYLISNFGNLNILHVMTQFFAADFVITGIVMFLIHLFFATRIYLLTKNRWTTALVVSCSTTMLILSILTITHDNYLPSAIWSLEITLFHVVGTVTDLIVTTILCWVFFKSTRATSFKSTRLLLKHLLVFIVSRCVLVALVQVAHLVMFALKPTNVLFWASLHLPLSHLYVITMLVMLNMRQSAGADSDVNESLHFVHSLLVTGEIGTRISLSPAGNIINMESEVVGREPKDVV